MFLFFFRIGRAGDAALVELLMGPIGKADPCLRDGDGNQPLHIAASCGHLDVVKVMAEKAGADLSEDCVHSSPVFGGTGACLPSSQ